MMKTQDMMDVNDVLEILSVDLLGMVPEDKDIIVSTNRGEPLVLREGPNLPRASQAYKNIVRRIAGEEVPFMDLETPSHWVDRVKQFFKVGSGVA